MNISAPRVLVVDDDEAVRIVASEMLKRSDYDYESVASGPEALARLKETEFDLVLLDVGMPIMSGVETYEHIRRDLPDQKVLFMTGYAEEEISELSNPNTFMLSKPFSLQTFDDTLSSII